MRFNNFALQHLRELRQLNPALASVIQRVLDDLDLDPPPLVYQAHPLLASAFLVLVADPGTHQQWAIVWHRVSGAVHIAVLERWDDN